MVKFDVNLSVGRWPFRPYPYEDMKALTEYVGRYGITGGFVRSAEAAFSRDPMEENRRLRQRCEGFDGFIPLQVVHPHWKLWKELLGTKAVVMYPTYQGFGLRDRETMEMAKAFAESGTILAVVLREEDERAQHPLCKIPSAPIADVVALAESVPETSVIILNGAGWEACNCTLPNMFSDIAYVDNSPALPGVIDKIGDGKLLFGTHSPYFCTSAAIAKVEAPEVSAATKEKIYSANIQSILKG